MIALQNQLQRHLEQTLQPYRLQHWREQLDQETPWKFRSGHQRREFIRCMFYPGDRIWMGNVYDSGQPHHCANFKAAYEWLDMDSPPSRCAAGVFRKGSYHRSRDNVLNSPFIVIESDCMNGYKPVTDSEKERNKASSFALIQYLRDKWEMNLRAVIDTGNKSLHAWFDRPSQHVMDCLVHMAQSHNIDEGLVLHCQNSPLRMPNCIHASTNKPAQLLYLKSYSQCTY